jgi:hypothetical protein
LYRAIDRDGTLVDVMLNEHRDLAAAKAFFRSAKMLTGVTPDRLTTDGPMLGLKNTGSARRFCSGYDEVRNFLLCRSAMR